LFLSSDILSDDIQQLDAALRAHAAGDATTFAELLASPWPVEVRESIIAAIVNPPNVGRPKAERDAFGATPRDQKLIAAYEAYHDALDSGVPSRQAEDAARKLCKTTDSEFAKLLCNGNARVNPVLRQRRTLRSKIDSLKLLKSSAAPECG
jgi:hypothetical protein